MPPDHAPLWLPASLVETLVKEAAAAAPREACGLLIGRGRRVERVEPASNVDPAATRYAIAPADHFAALRRARQDDLEVIGAYHSHPAGGPEPSATDTAEAFADFFYVIVGLAPAPAIAVWRLEHGNFVAVSLVRT